MSLSLALNTARSSIFATSTQIETTARNISGASDAGSSRKIAVTTTSATGGAYVVSISRAVDTELYSRMLGATSRTADQQSVLDGLDRLQAVVGDPASETSVGARIGKLDDALVTYANAPDEPALGSALVTTARDLATTLNSASAAVQTVRSEADTAMARSVARVNDLLGQFESENIAVVRGTSLGADVTDALDRRDGILSKIAEEMGVTTQTRGNNDMVIYTDSGVTLFETRPRAVAFKETPVYQPGTVGRSVTVDGVEVTGADATMPLSSGRLVGLATLRDDVTVTFQTQLDETARGLIEAFAEKDRTATGGPARPGLFTAGSTSLPTASTGLAGRIAVSAAADPSRGGSPTVLRDGGINGAAYVANASGQAGYAGALNGLHDTLGAIRSFDATSQLDPKQSLKDFSSASIGWLAGVRQNTSSSVDSTKALLAHASNALSNATGINMDDEYARQLELERSYQASSKLISVISGLFDTLMQSVR